MRKVNIALGITTGVLVVVGAFLIFKRLRLSNFKRRLIDNTNREWELWGKSEYNDYGGYTRGSRECDNIYRERVAEYWKKGPNRDREGCDGIPWSSAFISYVMKKSGAGNDFEYSSAHTDYIRRFINNRKKNIKSPFKAYRLREKPVELGDLICYSRQANVDYDTTWSYKSHCDIVVNVDKRRNKAEVIGGNVTDGVTKRIVNLSDKGYLRDTSQDWFTIIKNKK